MSTKRVRAGLPKRRGLQNKDIHRRLAAIRQQNVQRHESAAATQDLRSRIVRHQQNETRRMELDRLRGATVQGHLHQAALQRIAELKEKLK